VSREMFDRAQELLSGRREQYNGQKAENTRNSTKYLFSSLIRCETCGGTFTRKSYKHSDGSERVYWKCSTNDRSASACCTNRVKIDEKMLVETISNYFKSVVKDRIDFAHNVAVTVKDKRGVQSEMSSVVDIERRKTRLEFKCERYREMCAEGVITVSELKNKLFLLEKELLNLNELLNNYKDIENIFVEIDGEERGILTQIDDFLALESVSNVELRRILEGVTVNENGDVRVRLRRFLSAKKGENSEMSN
jgi:hypothetical protein